MEQFVIEVKNVSKSFKGIPVLNDINITCRNGKIYGIIGYNGSGKTVLFKCICGFLHVDSGEISVNCPSLFALRKIFSFPQPLPCRGHSSVHLKSESPGLPLWPGRLCSNVSAVFFMWIQGKYP